MKRYRITYRQANDLASPIFLWYCQAASRLHAEEKFMEGESEGWEIISVELAPKTNWFTK